MLRQFFQCILFATMLLTGAVQASNSELEKMHDSRLQAEILQQVNAYRAKYHLPALKMSAAITAEALLHSRDMASNKIPFGHQYFETRTKRLYKTVGHCQAAAENVALYKLNAEKLVQAWIGSPLHRQNILGNYNLTGIGIAHGKKGWAYYTQMFLRSKG